MYIYNRYESLENALIEKLHRVVLLFYRTVAVKERGYNVERFINANTEFPT